MAVNCATNRWACSNIIVAPTIAEGASYTTITAALAAASSGDTICIKPGTYTENITLVDGVDLCTLTIGEKHNQTVTLKGKITFGTCVDATISGLYIETNSDYFIEDTGSTAGTITFYDCSLLFNSDAINLNNSNRELQFERCILTRLTNSTKLATVTSCASIGFRYCALEGQSYTPVASTIADGDWSFSFCSGGPLAHVTSTGTSSFQCLNSTFGYNGGPTVWTLSGTGTVHRIYNTYMDSGSAAPLVVNGSASARVANNHFYTSNASPVTGTGSITFTDNSFYGTSGTPTATTFDTGISWPGITRSTTQPAFLAYNSANDTNQTGNGATVTVEFDTEIFDQNSEFNSTTDTFTATYTGRYEFSSAIQVATLTSSMTEGYLNLTTSNHSFELMRANPFGLRGTSSGALCFQGSALADLDAADTAYIQMTVSGGAGDTCQISGGGNQITYFCGSLQC